MLVNNFNNDKVETSHVEFVSYTGDWPNACRGVLTLKIDGQEYKFGHESRSYDVETGKYKDDNYNGFWESGGSINVDSNNEIIYTNEWRVSLYRIPKEFRKYAAEIDYIFNQNVKWGCCGGCI